MRILIIGNGGREHTLARIIAQDPEVTELFIAPGNPGTALVGTNVPVELTSVNAIVKLATYYAIDLVVIGPEIPLILGVADALRSVGIAVFGPSAAAAQIEGSKVFAKEIMRAAKVRTAHSQLVDSPADLDTALDNFGPIWVVKDDGLASGKGVVVTNDRSKARLHAAGLLESGKPVLLENYLDGPEVSLFSFVSGETVIPLLPAQDAKRLNDGDKGPNTGGMGAYSPLPWLSQDYIDEIVETITKPVAAELVHRGSPFTGLLYTGLALSSDGPTVIEFNCRFGDPETQVVLELLETPLAKILYDTAIGKLNPTTQLQWRSGYAIVVVLATQFYPGKPRIGDIIQGLPTRRPERLSQEYTATYTGLEGSDSTKQSRIKDNLHAHVIYAGTAINHHGEITTAGGRVLSIVAYAEELSDARDKAYRLVDDIIFPGKQYRKDIALAAVREQITIPHLQRNNQS